MSIIEKFNKSDKKLLNIIIVGVGNIGVAITEQLSHEGHEITIIDKNAEKVKRISEQYDVL
ncbi:MAG: NAD-binding protein, partial [Clostridia bacterium]|nr:NAD-binding protein [Clostridia bacterium]